jgi:hypothetical protein
MKPQNFRFGGGTSGTVLHPLIAAMVVITIVLIFILKRDKVIAPFILAYFTVPAAQVLVVGGVHLFMRQILILAVLVRMIAFPGQTSVGRFSGGLNKLDWVVVLWALSAVIIFNVEWMQTQALIKSLGDLIESLGGYLAARFLITDRDAVRRAIKLLAIICVIQGVCMMSEQFTHQNVFAFAGANSPTFRDGHIRAEGAMGGLYAGAIAGALVPMFCWLWTERKSRMAAYAGLGGAGAMIFASHASTSWMTLGGSVMALAFWPLRKQMRMVRWGIVATLVGLQCVMHGPVWSLIEKVDVTGGSSSYHRYELVDNTIRHFGEWWLIGYKSYASWGFCMFDLCNQFVVAAVTGGLVTLVLFIMIFKRGFGAVGTARKRVGGDRTEEWFYWCLGAFLFSCVTNSFGINYMFHLLNCFLLLLACISVATTRAWKPAVSSERAQASDERDFACVAVETGVPSEQAGWGGWQDLIET